METTISGRQSAKSAGDLLHVTRLLPYLMPAARAMFAAIFINSAIGHFSPETIGYAAAKGIPLAALLVPASGVIAFAGGLSVLLGYRARAGAWLLVAFLIPVTVTMHDFWTIEDPMMAMMDRAMFFKNVSMLGGALFIAYFGAGPLSLDARRSTWQSPSKPAARM